MEMLQLKYFYESAKNESFSKTAQKFIVPLTSVSASIKRLEKELDCTLFDRYNNGIKLNENGKKLQNSLCIIFDELNRVTDELSPKNNNNYEIKISVCALRNEITDYIIEYSQIHSKIKFKTIFETDQINEDIDIIIDDNIEKYPEYKNFELLNRRIRLKASSKNPLCNKKIKLKNLCNLPFLSMGEHTSIHKTLVNACKKEGFTPKFIVYTNDLQCYYKYIEADIGIGAGREEYNEKRNISALDVEDFVSRQTIYALYKDEQLNSNIKEFLDFLKSKIKY